MKLTMTFEDIPDGKVKVESNPAMAPIMRKLRDKYKAAKMGVTLSYSDVGLSPAEAMAGECTLLVLSQSQTTEKQKLIL